MEYLSSCDSWRVLWSWRSTSNNSTSIWHKENSVSCQQSWHQTHPDCFLFLSLSFALAFPSAAVLNNLKMFLVIVCDGTFEDVRYGISHRCNSDVSGCIYIYACIYVYMYSSTAETALHHAWMHMLVGESLRPGREARALQYQKRYKASLAAPASNWELRSQWQVSVGLP